MDSAEIEVQLLRRELAFAYDVIDELPDEALDHCPTNKLLVALRAMEEADKRADFMAYADKTQARIAELEQERDELRAALAVFLKAVDSVLLLPLDSVSLRGATLVIRAVLAKHKELKP